MRRRARRRSKGRSPDSPPARSDRDAMMHGCQTASFVTPFVPEEATTKQQLKRPTGNQSPKHLIPHNLLAPPAGLEPATHGLGNWAGYPRGALGAFWAHPAWQSVANRVLAGPSGSYKRSYAYRVPPTSCACDCARPARPSAAARRLRWIAAIASARATLSYSRPGSCQSRPRSWRRSPRGSGDTSSC